VSQKQNRLGNPLLAGGVVLIILGLTSLSFWPSDWSREYRDFFASMFGAAAVAMILIAVVEARHLREALNENAKRIVEHSGSQLDKKFDDSFDILHQCNQNGLYAIHLPRQVEPRICTLHTALQGEIAKTKKLSIIGVSGLDFFSSPLGAATTAGPYYEACKTRLIPSHTPKLASLDIRALLLNPTCDAAKNRDTLEIVDGVPASIARDINIAKHGIETLNRLAKRSAIEYIFYDTTPQLWAVITDDYVFVEPYHSAPTEKLCSQLQEMDLPASQEDRSCTGGRVPVLQFSKRSNMYLAVQVQFEYMWSQFNSHGRKTQANNVIQPIAHTAGSG